MQEILDKMNEARREHITFTHIANQGRGSGRIGKDLQRDTRDWISPPNPWENHITARESHYEGTSRWFVESNTFAKWKSSSPDLLLWIHGKRACLSHTYFHFR